jgi:hypothetical protein
MALAAGGGRWRGAKGVVSPVAAATAAAAPAASERERGFACGVVRVACAVGEIEASSKNHRPHQSINRSDLKVFGTSDQSSNARGGSLPASFGCMRTNARQGGKIVQTRVCAFGESEFVSEHTRPTHASLRYLDSGRLPQTPPSEIESPPHNRLAGGGIGQTRSKEVAMRRCRPLDNNGRNNGRKMLLASLLWPHLPLPQPSHQHTPSHARVVGRECFARPLPPRPS